MNGDLYSDYIRRKPHPRSEVLIRKWHGKLLAMAIQNTAIQPSSLFEVGPGHGYLAEHCKERGIKYEFCDTSPAVVAKMTELGFKGYEGMAHDIASRLGKYDMIWMSHVLEHSPTWIDARQMMKTSMDLLTDKGVIVVVSPDVLNWRREFWNVDWSHGYPTSVRNVSQLCSDVGLTNISAVHHRNGTSNILIRSIFTLITMVPHRLVDRMLSPERYKIGDGFTYSWKCVFGWRQIMVQASR